MNNINILLNFNKYNNIIFISPNGNDSNDGKTRLTAVKHPEKAVELASDGDLIYLINGTYDYFDAYGGCPNTTALNDTGKKIDIYGDPFNVIIKIDAMKYNSTRDYGILSLNNAGSRLFGCTFDFYNKRSENYNRSIFTNSSGYVYNSIFIVRENASMTYDNNYVNSLKCYNCTLDFKNGICDSWSGNAVNFEKCIFFGINKLEREMRMNGVDNIFNPVNNDISSYFLKNTGYGVCYGEYVSIYNYVANINNVIYAISSDNLINKGVKLCDKVFENKTQILQFFKNKQFVETVSVNKYNIIKGEDIND